MGSRIATEEKARYKGNLYHEPTIKPGLGSPRCPRCFSLISASPDANSWAMAPVLRDTFTMVGTTGGGTISAFQGFNKVMPLVQSRFRGPMWLHFIIGIPPVMLWSLAWAAFGGSALPAFAQASVSSYYSASAASHYTVSQLTRRIEKFAAHLNRSREPESNS
eukprot:TRINITY_DN12076_c0_g1_i2.p1 TRINITY_DN12076_c0_g1~~TRINITY_DN12076_c0_g1_i2.p1  ORF type:complete len:163 (+),score=31.55 TRINITY_DN12076_c0_g1_i2:170-658(+)